MWTACGLLKPVGPMQLFKVKVAVCAKHYRFKVRYTFMRGNSKS